MGMRMHIMDENGNDFGDDHKFYGYYDYDCVKTSFAVIYPLLKEQWDYIRDECETIEEAYDYFKWTPYTSEVEVPEDVFKTFALQYVADLILADKPLEVINIVIDYIVKLINTPGTKKISWA